MEPIVLTLAEVLERHLFQDAQIVAGRDGLNRIVRWVHVLEVADVGSLLHGNELILSTGGGFRNDVQLQEQYIHQLIEKKASGLCIELGYHINEIPPIMLEIAERENFPLIHLVTPVRFIDVTQDVNAWIINRHYELMGQLDQISRDFQRLTLKPKATYQIMKLLSERTGATTNLRLVTGEILRYPETETNQIEAHPSKYKISQTVQAMGRVWGELWLELEHPAKDEYLSLLVDRASIAVSQDFLRKLTLMERELKTDNFFIESVIKGEIESEEQGWNNLGYHPDESKRYELLFLILEWENQHNPHNEEEETLCFHSSILLRTYLEANGFKPYFSTRKNELSVLILDYHSRSQHRQPSYTERLLSVMKQMDNWFEKQSRVMKLRFGVSRPFRSWTRGKSAYLEAAHTLSRDVNGNDNPFYKEAGVVRLLWNQTNPELLEGYVEDYLGPVLNYDRTRKAELLKTLEIFFDCDGSKSETAERLFIHRQTLYHRLDKLKELLGEDFMVSENRLSIEMALKAYHYLSK
jgi:purine catabolism regulator